MKTQPSRNPQVDPSDPAAPQQKRRQLVVGAGLAAGAAVAAAAALKAHRDAPAAVAKADADSTPSEGYRLTDHVRRYYETTRT